MTTTTWFCDWAWLPEGWTADVRLTVAADGALIAVAGGKHSEGCERLGRYVLPGVPNAHSHAFQFAMAGRAERTAGGEDDFWSWREAMYRLTARFTPERLHAVASMLYAELLANGYTAVAEFHYLHHLAAHADGGTEAADALIAAARDTGIGLTLLPTLYQRAGFDGRAPSDRQQRFVLALDDYGALLEHLRAGDDGNRLTGVALHSLRAVSTQAVAELLASPAASGGPIHIHIAEQLGEVRDCVSAHGQRPVEWLLGQAPLDPRWCLVHATHMADAEVRALAQSAASVALCPSTEANLGDGLFRLVEFLDAGGRICIGSDSHIGLSPFEELRWLEYGQRLAALKRNRVASAQQPSCGERLWRAVLDGGAQALGRPIGALAPGHRADWLVLDPELAAFAACPPQQWLDGLIFAAQRSPVASTYVGGRKVAEGGRHVDHPRIAGRFARAMRELWAP